jgi:5-methylcytosine-specific restriction protein A
VIPRQCILRGPKCSDRGRAVPGKSRCAAHGGGAWARTSPASRSRYDAQWRQIRGRVLQENPRCQTCGETATDVHHVVAAADGGGDDRSNLRSVCRQCHKRHTVEQNRARHKAKRREGAS